MREASLKLKNYANNVTIVDSGNLEKRIFHFMLSALGVLAISYVFILTSMVFNIVERKSLESRELSLVNEVNGLEVNYFAESQKIDLDMAHSMGFKEAKTKFATRKAIGSISIAKNEI